MKNCARYLFIVLLVFISISAHAQVVPDTTLNQPIPEKAIADADTIRMYADTIRTVADTVPVAKNMPFQPIPKRAGLYSAIFPGMGQVYNRQYWKLPIIYAGVGAGIYFIASNQKSYEEYRQAYIARVDNNPYNNESLLPQYDTEALRQLQEQYRKYRDMSILLTAVGYSLQIMDAVASAHLKNFDISRDISLKMRPVADPTGIGFGLVMNFR